MWVPNNVDSRFVHSKLYWFYSSHKICFLEIVVSNTYVKFKEFMSPALPSGTKNQPKLKVLKVSATSQKNTSPAKESM